MKNLVYLLIGLLCSVVSLAQTDAISYQAVILNPDAQQLPGFDVPATVLPDADVSLRFTIINKDGFVEFKEQHDTTTDPFGMVNLNIGKGNQMTDLKFTEVLWDGTNKTLLVEIDFYSLGEFVQLSSEELTFTPQAFHRDIIATGDMTVDGSATFNDSFTIRGETIIKDDLEVDGNTTIGGNTDIGGSTTIGEDLTVDGVTNLNSELFVNNGSNTQLSGELDVEGQTRINDGGIEVANEATIGGDTTIGGNVNVGGDQVVEGDMEIQRRLNVFLPTTLNDDLTVGGRTDLGGALTVDGLATIDDGLDVGGDTSIDGELSTTGRTIVGAELDVAGKATINDNLTVNAPASINADFKVDNAGVSTLTGTLSVDGKTDFNNSVSVNNSSPTFLGGTLQVVKNAVFDDDVLIDGMLTVNNNFSSPNLIISGEGGVSGDHIALFENTGGNGADGIAIQISQPELNANNNFVTFLTEGSGVAGRIESFNEESLENQGVVYGSRGADYAEWLEKENPSADFKVGEVVGVKGGKISRVTVGADHVLSISKAPIVLGNMPDEDQQEAFEKVGFMGQVPVLVKGEVAVGDYIVASGNNDGLAKAVATDEITVAQLTSVIGKAWSSSTTAEVSTINVSAGLKSNEWVNILQQQQNKIQHLEDRMEQLEALAERMKQLEKQLKDDNSN